jgi:hypothetical protein
VAGERGTSSQCTINARHATVNRYNARVRLHFSWSLLLRVARRYYACHSLRRRAAWSAGHAARGPHLFRARAGSGRYGRRYCPHYLTEELFCPRGSGLITRTRAREDRSRRARRPLFSKNKYRVSASAARLVFSRRRYLEKRVVVQFEAEKGLTGMDRDCQDKERIYSFSHLFIGSMSQ